MGAEEITCLLISAFALVMLCVSIHLFKKWGIEEGKSKENKEGNDNDINKRTENKK